MAEKKEFEGTLTVMTKDHFKDPEFPDTYQGTERSPLIFEGVMDGVTYLLGGLEVVLKTQFPNLFIDNKPIPFKITIEKI
jgi:hypothetical protein